MHARSTLLVGIAAFLVLAGTAQAATLKVGKGRPHSTIASAVAAASPGDKIVVAKGRYVETVTVTTPDLTIRASRGVEWQPDKWGGTCVVIEGGGSGTTIQGFLFRGAFTAMSVQADSVSVVKCRFRGSWETLTVTGNDLRVVSCDIRQGSGGIEITGDRAVVDRTSVVGTRSSSLRIYGNDATITRCTARHVDDDPPISVYGDRARIERNRVGFTEEDGIRLGGNDAVIARNDIRLAYRDGVSVAGDRALIDRNVVHSSGDNAIDVRGNGCVVRDNRVDDVINAEGILVGGNDALVAGNQVTGMAKANGIDVSGLAFTIDGNRVSDFGYAATGIRAGNGMGGGGRAQILDNLVVGSPGDGIAVDGSGVLVSGNRVEDCSGTGMGVFGDGHELKGNVAVGIGFAGFYLDTVDTVATACVASDCAADGFRIESQSTGIELNDCRASDCAADGLHNSGIAVFTGCTFTRNRQDVASSGGTLTDGGGNSFDTGGVSSSPID